MSVDGIHRKRLLFYTTSEPASKAREWPLSWRVVLSQKAFGGVATLARSRENDQFALLPPRNGERGYRFETKPSSEVLL